MKPVFVKGQKKICHIIYRGEDLQNERKERASNVIQSVT